MRRNGFNAGGLADVRLGPQTARTVKPGRGPKGRRLPECQMRKRLVTKARAFIAEKRALLNGGGLDNEQRKEARRNIWSAMSTIKDMHEEVA